MLNRVIKSAIAAFVLVAVSGCLPVLVGGAIWHDAKENEQCITLLSTENFKEKMTIAAFRGQVADVCDVPPSEIENLLKAKESGEG